MDAVRFDDEIVELNPHPSAIRTADKVDPRIIHRFVLSSIQTIDWLSIEEPRPPLLIDDRQGEIMAAHVFFHVLPVRETVLDQLPPNAS